MRKLLNLSPSTPILATVAIGLVTTFSSGAATKTPPLNPSWSEFQKFCQANRVGATNTVIPPPPLNQIVYISPLALEASQGRFSFDRLLEAFAKVRKQEGIASLKKLPHAHGQSIYPEKRRITGIYYRGKIYVIDGHHRALISTYAGAKLVPVEIHEDWSLLSPDVFFSTMKANGYSYLQNYRGRSVKPVDLCLLVDDPMLLLVRKIILRVDFSINAEGEVKIQARKGKHHSFIALKLNRDIPFIELEMADRLRRAGIQWQPGDKIRNRDLKAFLSVLNHRRDRSRLKHVLLLDQPTHMADLDLSREIKRHLARHQCEMQLLSGDRD